MNNKDKNRELLSRRDFFKKAAINTLPFIAMITIPSYLSSCNKEDDPINSGCKDCSSNCESGCDSLCAVACSNDCSGACRDSCLGTCEDGCKNTCPQSCGAGCSSSCGFNCSFDCGTTCHKTAF